MYFLGNEERDLSLATQKQAQKQAQGAFISPSKRPWRKD